MIGVLLQNVPQLDDGGPEFTLLPIGVRAGNQARWIGRLDAARATCKRQRRQNDHGKTTRLNHCCGSNSVMYSAASRSVGRGLRTTWSLTRLAIARNDVNGQQAAQIPPEPVVGAVKTVHAARSGPGFGAARPAIVVCSDRWRLR